MSNYQFTGQTPRFYPDIVGPHGSLIAVPGDVCEFENPPTDGLWFETKLPATDTDGRSWPIQEAPEPGLEEEPEPLPVAPATDPPVILSTPHIPFTPEETVSA